MKQRIFVQGFLMVLATVAVIVFHRLFFPQWGSEFGEEIADVSGTLLVLHGFLLRIVARGYKKSMSLQSQALVTQGIYRITRNPMYLGTFLIGVGVILVTQRWWVFLVFLGIFLMIYLPQMKREEVWLLDHFGEDYRRYQAGVPKILPNLLVLFKRDFWTEVRFEWEWFRSELQAMIVTLSLITVIEVWQDARLFGMRECVEEGAEMLGLIGLTLLVWFLLYRLSRKKTVGVSV